MDDSESQSKDSAAARLAETILQQPQLLESGVSSVKISLAEKAGIRIIPANTEIIKALKACGAPPTLLRRLRRKPVRSRSGVTIITVAIPLFNCPHGRCIYCPGGGET